jgi:cytochrome c oxidase subunit 2
MTTKRELSRLAGGLLAALAAVLAWPAVEAQVNELKGGPLVNEFDLQPPNSQIAFDQQWLHNFMLVLCLVIFIAVFGVMFYSILRHRKSKGVRASNFHESTTVEIAWTIVPFIIVILMALPATRVVVAMKDTSAADLTIKATGLQWKWGYDYLNGEGAGIGFPVDPRHGAARDVGNRQARGRRLPPQGRQPAHRPGQQEGPHHHDGGRRDPRVGCAAPRRQAGRDPRLRARHLVPRRPGR